MKFLIMHSSPASCTLLFLKYKYTLHTMFSKSLILYSSLGVKDRVSYPYETTGKVMVFLYFNLYVFREETGRQETLKRMVASIPQI